METWQRWDFSCSNNSSWQRDHAKISCQALSIALSAIIKYKSFVFYGGRYVASAHYNFSFLSKFLKDLLWFTIFNFALAFLFIFLVAETKERLLATFKKRWVEWTHAAKSKSWIESSKKLWRKPDCNRSTYQRSCSGKSHYNLVHVFHFFCIKLLLLYPLFGKYTIYSPLKIVHIFSCIIIWVDTHKNSVGIIPLNKFEDTY